MNETKTLLTFAGFDPSAGAGILLDVSVFRSTGFHGTAVITALTTQNTLGVRSTYCPPFDFIREQYRILEEDTDFCGIKTGMLGSVDNLPLLSKILTDNADIPAVVDPVFRSTSGTWLFDENRVSDFVAQIKGKATLLTPNTQEAALISGQSAQDRTEMKIAAKKIYDACGFPCLITGGQLKNSVMDILYDGHTFQVYENEKLDKRVHGTGCFLSSKILCCLVLGKDLDSACASAISATHKAIERAEPIGRGQHVIVFRQTMNQGL